MLRILSLALALAACGFWALEADAALKSKKDLENIDPVATYNPKAAEGDIILPMPNGLQFVLRPVEVQAEYLLKDQPVSMGSGAKGDREIFDGDFTAYISAPFRISDLPKSWRDVIKNQDKNAKDDDLVYYFIGKYELSNGQWDAVMGTNSGERPDLPKAHISWYDLQDFLRKYNEWLLANHADKLPAIEGEPGYFRLPNEAEWEYAARGGNVAAEKDEEHDPMNLKPQNYAIFGASQPAAIGARMPDDLGLHDMRGNVAELTQDGFRFTITDAVGGNRVNRLHGAEGGLVIKGGSFRNSDPEELKPYRREEARMFQKGESGEFAPFSARNTGARLVFTALNAQGHNRLKQLQGEKEELRRNALNQNKGAAKEAAPAPVIMEGERVRLDRNGNPVDELEKIYVVTKSDDMKSNLDQLREILGDVSEALTRERDSNMRNAMSSTVYIADSLNNIAFRCFDMDNLIAKAKVEKTLDKKREKQYNEVLDNHFKNLIISTNVYRINAANIAKFPPEDIDRLSAALARQHRGKDKVNEAYTANLNTLVKHAKAMQAKGMRSLTDKMIWDDIIRNKTMRKVVDDLQKKNQAERESHMLELLDDERAKAGADRADAAPRKRPRAISAWSVSC